MFNRSDVKYLTIINIFSCVVFAVRFKLLDLNGDENTVVVDSNGISTPLIPLRPTLAKIPELFVILIFRSVFDCELNFLYRIH